MTSAAIVPIYIPRFKKGTVQTDYACAITPKKLIKNIVRILSLVGIGQPIDTTSDQTVTACMNMHKYTPTVLLTHANN